LRDKSIDEMKAAMSNDYPADQADGLIAALPEKIERINSAVIFEPLFADSQLKMAAI